MISEYARGPGGWLMQLAFFCVAVSSWTLAVAVWTYLPPLGPLLLVACGFGFAGAGVFVTDPVSLSKPSQTRSGALHVLFAFAVIVLFPITATIVDAGLAGGVARISSGPWLSVLSILTWTGFISFLVSAVYSALGGQTPLGYFERFLVLTYSVWLIAMGPGLVTSLHGIRLS